MPLDTRLAALITAIGADIKALQAASGGAENWLDYTRKEVRIFEEFRDITKLNGDVAFAGSGTGNTMSQAGSVNGTFGVANVNPGTDAFGRAAIRASPFAPLGRGAAYFSSKGVMSWLSAAPTTFVVRVGFGDTDFGVHGLGAFFEYDASASANWRCRATNYGAVTTVDSGVVVTAGAWVTFGIELNANATSCKFYINGNLVATITTNLPNQASSVMAGWWMNKATGPDNRWFLVDFISAQVRLTTPR